MTYYPMEFKKELRRQLVMHEGLRLYPYKCTAGKLTIGVGRNLGDKGITEVEAMYLLDQDIQECVLDLQRLIVYFDNIDDVRRMVLIDMRFNLGGSGFRNFRRMLKAVENRDWDTAANEMEKSRWYQQVGRRSVRLVKMMREGKQDCP